MADDHVDNELTDDTLKSNENECGSDEKPLMTSSPPEDFAKSLMIDGNAGDSSVSRLRWRIIKNAFHTKSPPSEPTNGSIRRFSTFGLIDMKEYKDNDFDLMQTTRTSLIWPQTNDTRGKWFTCEFAHDVIDCNERQLIIDIRILTEKIAMKELLHGFDNTGNVCLWPSEEVLAFYCFKNRGLFEKKVVCELGGGMTCLSGLVAGFFCHVKRLILTDGNQRSVTNVETIVEANRSRFLATNITCKQLVWGDDNHINDFRETVDVILCSDCLYFDDGREPLVATIWKLLRYDGMAIIMAPTRGSTLETFVDLAKSKFDVQQILKYDDHVWRLHQRNLKSTAGADIHYKTDLHYPHMIVLRKRHAKS